MSAVWKENMILYVLTDLMIKTYKVWRYRLNYVLSKYTQMTRTSPYVGSSHANIQLKNSTTTALHTACLALAPQVTAPCSQIISEFAFFLWFHEIFPMLLLYPKLKWKLLDKYYCCIIKVQCTILGGLESVSIEIPPFRPKFT